VIEDVSQFEEEDEGRGDEVDGAVVGADDEGGGERLDFFFPSTWPRSRPGSIMSRTRRLSSFVSGRNVSYRGLNHWGNMLYSFNNCFPFKLLSF